MPRVASPPFGMQVVCGKDIRLKMSLRMKPGSQSGTGADFYNQRRRKAHEVKPNRGHEILVELEKQFDVTIITQNVDDLHERAGSSRVIHLHGSLFESRSTKNPNPFIQLKVPN